MRLATLLLTALLAVPELAVAESRESTPAAPFTSISAPQQAPVEERDPQFALGFTIGAPDGAVLSFAWSPLWWLMLDAGFAYTLAPGMVFGVELRPIDFFVFPVIHGEYGYYFAGQTSDRIKSWASVPENIWPLVGDASYNWWSALVGIGFGSRRGFEVRLEGGVTWLSLNVKGGTSNVNGVQITADPWKSQAFAPTARVNFMYFL
jgi:hypothetical protein